MPEVFKGIKAEGFKGKTDVHHMTCWIGSAGQSDGNILADA